MAVTRDELIAKVYEKCGREVVRNDYTERPDEFVELLPNGTVEAKAIGLDEFVSDIVPVLNERGWFVQLSLQRGYPKDGDGEWAASLIGPGWTLRKVESTDPVEAAFAVALEVLGE